VDKPTLRDGSNKKIKTFMRSNTNISQTQSTRNYGLSGPIDNIKGLKINPQEELSVKKGAISKSVTPKGKRTNELRGAGL
jgi:hypothetical protein